MTRTEQEGAAGESDTCGFGRCGKRVDSAAMQNEVNAYDDGGLRHDDSP